MSQNTLADVFGSVIHQYSRRQAIADGYLVDVSTMAQEAGFVLPVALTRAAWEDCVAWDDGDNRRHQTIQDESGRLWDVLTMLRIGIRSRPNQAMIQFSLVRVPRTGRGRLPRKTRLKAIIGPGDEGSPVITVMMPDED